MRCAESRDGNASCDANQRFPEQCPKEESFEGMCTIPRCRRCLAAMAPTGTTSGSQRASAGGDGEAEPDADETPPAPREKCRTKDPACPSAVVRPAAPPPFPSTSPSKTLPITLHLHVNLHRCTHTQILFLSPASDPDRDLVLRRASSTLIGYIACIATRRPSHAPAPSGP